MDKALSQLGKLLHGKLYSDDAMRLIYATDASAYREVPLAVAVPKNDSDIRELIHFAAENNITLIPRAAGTSLAGQVVGKGMVVDISRHFTAILELNIEEKWVRVQPGVIRDELNQFLRPHGLYFGPETSTANRAMIGGMVGNNSCGSNSVVYGSTREHLLEVKGFLSDGTPVVFGALDPESFHTKCEAPSLEGKIYQQIRQALGNTSIRQEIEKGFPRKGIERRNTGYAVDLLMHTSPFEAGGPDFNFSTLLAGSEGTLMFMTEVKLNLVALPPPVNGLLCIHCSSIRESLLANLTVLEFGPDAVELIDHYVLECTKNNLQYSKNRFFVQGDPQAILVASFSANNEQEIWKTAAALEARLREQGLGYHFPLIFGNDTARVWGLRKAGLGLLGNMPGDEKAVAVIEDTAVTVQDLPDYIADFNEILARYGMHCVHYAHAGSGELHLRPILNLKTVEGQKMYRIIAEEIAALVKKYDGSLSGEHGDGRLRAEFLPRMVGEKNYLLLQNIKRTWDPAGVFNKGKIVDAPPMDKHLRYKAGREEPQIETFFRYGGLSVLQHAEQCNGSGDCRKTHHSGGTMCPSYMGTRDEQSTTRARANILREFLTNSKKINRFDHDEIKGVMDLCLSCKACKSECPSNVDVAKLKAEFLQHYYDANGVPPRARLIGNFVRMARLGSTFSGAYNFMMSAPGISQAIRKTVGFSPRRSMPKVAGTTLKSWFKTYRRHQPAPEKGRKIFLFCDEFTNYNDVRIGEAAIRLLEALGYHVEIPKHQESGRSRLSKGLLREARKIADANVQALAGIISEATPLVGIEPSAILCFRDEYPDLVSDKYLDAANHLKNCSFTFEEFLALEIAKGNIDAGSFTTEKKLVLLHGHCQQKAISNLTHSQAILSLPSNFSVEIIPSGCCGMAGSFGYEAEHYDLSMKIGELVLFPAVRNAPEGSFVVAAGTSCRHQIKDGTGQRALHPAELLWAALNK